MQPNAPAMLQMFPLIIIVVFLYFFLIRPQQKKQKEHQAMLVGLKKNDEVVTTGGIHGTIVNVKEKTFVLRVDESSKMEIDKQAVAYTKKVREQA